MQVIKADETPFQYARYYMGLDPAPGGTGENLDYFNITVLALHGGNADIVFSLDMRKPIPNQIEMVGLIHDRFQRMGRGVIAIGGARVSLDRYFRGALVAKRADLQAKLVDIGIPGQKEERLEALGAYAQSGWLRCQSDVWEALTSDHGDRYQEQSLYEQWRDFPHGKHDDKLDGLDVAVRCAREFANVADVEIDLEMIGAE
jgi:hypothetical protein